MSAQLKQGRCVYSAIVLSAIAGTAVSAHGQTTTTWNGGSGNWNDPTMWDNGLPNSAAFDVRIDGGNAAASSVFFNQDFTIGRLTVDTGDTLHLNNSRTLQLDSSGFAGAGSLIVNGSMLFDNAGSGIDLRFAADGALSGTGVIDMGTLGNSRLFSNTGGTLTIASGLTIQGAGQIGVNNTVIANSGTISGTQGGLTLLFASPGSNSATGVMQSSGGTLVLQGGSLANSGLIQALDNSQTQLRGGVAITGGTLATAGSGTISMSESSSLTDVTNTGHIVLVNGSTTFYGGTITNNGTITSANAGSGVDLRISGPVSLTGTGSIDLGAFGSTRLFANNSGDRLTVGTGQTIHGAGQIGVGNMSVTNHGLISADLAGQTLTIVPASGGDLTNTGTLQAANGATLVLQGGNGTFVNTGTVQALAGSEVQLNNGADFTGALSSVGSGVVRVTNTATLRDGVVTGTLDVNNSATLTLASSLTNNGTVSVLNAGSGTDIRIANPLTIGGTGAIDLGVQGNTRLFANTAGDRLTVGADQTIHGAGQIGVANMSVTNHGLISADVAGQTLTIVPASSGGDLTNTGTLQAAGGGTLVLQGGNGAFINQGTVAALAGSEVQLNNGADFTGALSSVGSGVVRVTNTATLRDALVGGTLDVNNSATLTLVNSLTNDGTISLLNVGSGVDIRIANPLTISGTGSIDMGALGNTRILASTGGDRLTVGAGQTIHGAGQIGVANMSITNDGLISADVAGQSITLLPAAGGDLTNHGTLEAANGATLVLQGGAGTFSSTGTLEALDNSQVQINNGATITGTLTTSGSGVIRNANSASLTDTIVNGHYISNNSSTTTLAGTITNNGVMTLDNQGSGVDFRIAGDVTINGSGSIDMGTLGNSRFLASIGGDRLTVGADQTIHGGGQLGVANMSITNDGLISADVASTPLAILPASGGDLTNHGTLQATNGATLVLQGGAGTFSSTGTLAAQDNSQVQIVNGATITGTLTTSGSGVIRNVNAATLTDTIINGHYISNNASTSTFAGTITNNGVITSDNVGSGVDFRIAGPVSIDGTGSIDLGTLSNTRMLANDATGALTLGAGQTVHGVGQLGVANMSITNNGLISADVAGQEIAIQPIATGSAANNGVWQATGGATLHLLGGSGSFTNTGTIQALDNSTVNFDASAVLTNNAGGTLTGGTYKAASSSAPATVNLPGGNVTTNAAAVYLSGAQSSIPVINTIATNTAGGEFHVLSGRAFTTVGALGNSGLVEVGGGSALSITGADYTQAGGRTIVDGTLTPGSGLFVLNGGVLSGNGLVAGAVLNTGGQVSPGSSPGHLSIGGDYTQQAGGQYTVEIAGVASGTQYDLLSVAGVASLNGNLTVTLLGGFVPQLGDSFTILDASALRGTFATFTAPTLSGLGFDVDYSSGTSVVLTVVPTPSAAALLAVPGLAMFGRRRRRA